MNTAREAEKAAAIPRGMGLTAHPTVMTRKRVVELTVMAKEIADNMDKRGIKPHERCQFGIIVQHMLQN